MPLSYEEFKRQYLNQGVETQPEYSEPGVYSQPNLSYDEFRKQYLASKQPTVTQEPVNTPTDLDGRSSFEKFVNFINRPNYAKNAAAVAALEGRGSDIIPEAQKGIMGQKKVEGYDVINKIFKPDYLKQGYVQGTDQGVYGANFLKDIGSRAAGFGLDVFTDPLSLLPIAKGASLLGKAAKALPGASKAGKALQAARNLSVVKPTINTLGKVFGTRRAGETKEEYEAIKDILVSARGEKSLAAKEGQDVFDFLRGERKKIGEGFEEGKEQIFKKRIDPDIPIEKPYEPFYDELSKIVRENTEARNKLGLSMKEEYDVMRLVDPEYAKKHPKPYKSGISAKFDLPAQYKRTIEGVKTDKGEEVLKKITGKETPEEILQWTPMKINQKAVEQNWLKPGEKMFVDEPEAIAKAMKIKTGELKAADEFATAMRNIGEKIGEGGAVKEGYKKSSFKLLQDWQFPEDVADHIEDAVKTYFDPSESLGAVKVLESVNKYFTEPIKRMWTSINPAFYYRNLVGGLRMSQIRSGFGAVTEYPSALKEILSGKIGDVNDLIKNGVIKTGRIAMDTPKILKELESKGPGVLNKMQKFGQDVSEDAIRLAQYRHLLKKGKSVKEAAKEVRLTHYDYGDLTQVEKEFLTKAFPFYTWMRNNIPRQIENMFTHPQRVAVAGKLKGNIEAGKEPVDPRAMQDERFRERGWIQYARDKEGKPILAPIQGYDPAAEVMRLKHPVQYTTEAINPAIKLLTEIASGRDSYTGRKIRPEEQQQVFPTVEALGLNKLTLPAEEFGTVLNMLRPKKDIERQWNKTQKDRGNLDKVISYLTGFKGKAINEEKMIAQIRNELDDNISKARTSKRYAMQVGDDAKAKMLDQEIEKYLEQKRKLMK